MNSVGSRLRWALVVAACASMLACDSEDWSKWLHGHGGGGSNGKTRILGVTASGAGSGTVTSSPAGIDCGATCAASFARGAAVTLTATPAGGSTFAGWGGACAGAGACVVAMDADRLVTAAFDRAPEKPTTCETPGGRLTSGEYIVANDTYVNAESSDPIGGYTQCASLAPGATEGTLEASWTWSWPAQASAITRATPTIIYGFKPWDPASTTPDLPRRIAEVASLTVDASVRQTVGAGEIAQFGVIAYLTTAPTKVGDTLPIAKRLFVYRNVYGMTPNPYPTAAQLSIGGMEWDLLVTPDFVMYTPHAGADVPATSLHVDVAAFLADALARGAVDRSWFVSSVETGMILSQGDGALALGDYGVRFEARQAPAHDRPATSSLRVVHGAGYDGQYGTADDTVAGYDQVVYQPNGDALLDAWYFGAGARGPDGVWLTADDEPQGWWSQPVGADHGWVLSGPGADGAWFTADDDIASWEQFGVASGGTAINVLYGGAGPDGVWFTPDDVVSGYHLRTLDPSTGAELRRVTYVSPGPDGVWLTADDQIQSGGYTVSAYSRGNNRWASWDLQTTYVGPGPDGVWLTADDEIGSYRRHTFDDDSEYWTTETTYGAGRDGVWFDADDVVTGFSRATNTYGGGSDGDPTSTFTLDVTRAGSGTGTISSSPSGISCGSTCTHGYASGTVVTLSAAALDGSTFAGWSGACTGTGSCVVMVRAAATVTATFVSHDRPALTARRVLYAAGSDRAFGTADDLVIGYDQVVFAPNGDSEKDTWYYNSDPRGPDGKWFTADDVPGGYWVQPDDTHGYNTRAPGADGKWNTADDPVTDWEKFGATENGVAINRLYDDPGADGQWFTADDVMSGYNQRTIDATGAEVRRVVYVDPGADGVWFTADDVPDSAGYWTATYSHGNTRWASWDRQVQYDGPGADGKWLTADDHVKECDTHAFADDSQYWTTENRYSPGADGKCFTADDVLLTQGRAVNTYAR